MSVLIKGMEMPKNCYDCPFAMRRYETLFVKGKSIRRDYGCVFTHRTITSTKRNRFCPLMLNDESFSESRSTNADRIRSMTDEELARWLSDMHDSVTCPNYGDTDCNPSCRVCWLDWLQMARGKANE